MSFQELLTDTWNWSPTLMAGPLLLIILYIYLHLTPLPLRSLFFFAGVLLLWVCLASPLSFLAGGYLFSAHMAQQMLLLLVVPPLLLVGCTENAIKKLADFLPFNFRMSPALTWLMGVGIMVFWHIPALFSTATASGLIPLCGQSTTAGTGWVTLVQTLSLLLAGGVFVWPVLSPLKRQRMPVFSGIAYLFTACLACSLLGLTITFSDTLLYGAYAARPGYGGADYLIRQVWRLSPMEDQQLGGLLMWVPGCVLYVTGAMVLLARWFNEQDTSPQAITA